MSHGDQVAADELTVRRIVTAGLAYGASATRDMGHERTHRVHEPYRTSSLMCRTASRQPGAGLAAPCAGVNLMHLPESISDEAAAVLTDNAPTA